MESRANFEISTGLALDRGRRDIELAEGARVDVAQLAALDEGEHDVRVLGLGVLGTLGAQQLAAHAEVDDEVRAVLQREDEVLAEALRAADRVALDHRAKVLGRLVSTHQAPVGDRDGLHLLADQVARQ